MAKAPDTLEITGKLDPLWTALKKVYELIARVVNGNISFGDGSSSDNIAGNWVTVTTPVAINTNFTVNHNLGRIPVGYWIMSKTAACDIYNGTVASTVTQITFKATGSAVDIKVFII